MSERKRELKKTKKRVEKDAFNRQNCLTLVMCIMHLDDGVRSISSYCPQLRELSLSECTGVGDQGVAQLSRLGPSLR